MQCTQKMTELNGKEVSKQNLLTVMQNVISNMSFPMQLISTLSDTVHSVTNPCSKDGQRQTIAYW